MTRTDIRFLPLLVVALLAGCAKKGTATEAAAAPAAGTAAAPAAGAVACDRPEMFGPVMLDAAAAAGRHGLGVTKLKDGLGSPAQPIEVCGVKGQHAWLQEATCPGGERPLAAPGAAADARVGNVGPGGRCGSIVDEYVVPCPKGDVTVYMDLYMCGPGEAFQ